MDHVFFIVGALLNLIFVVGLLADPRVRAGMSGFTPPGPLGLVKRDFFLAQQAAANRSVAAAAFIAVGILSVLYVLEFDDARTQLRAEGPVTFMANTSTALGAARQPSPPIDPDRIRSVYSEASAALRTFEGVNSAILAHEARPAPPPSRPRSRVEITDEDVSGAAGEVLGILQNSQLIRAQDEDGEATEGLGELFRRGFVEAGRAVLLQQLKADIDERIAALQADGETSIPDGIPSELEIRGSLTAITDRWVAEERLPRALLEDEMELAVTGVRAFLIALGQVRIGDGDGDGGGDGTGDRLSDETLSDLNRAIAQLQGAVNSWQALRSSVSSTREDVRRVMADINRAGEALNRALGGARELVGSGSVNSEALSDIIRRIEDAISDLQDAGNTADDLPVPPSPPIPDSAVAGVEIGWTPPAPVAPEPPVPAPATTGVAIGWTPPAPVPPTPPTPAPVVTGVEIGWVPPPPVGPEPPIPTPAVIGMAVGWSPPPPLALDWPTDRASMLTTSVFASLGAILVFLLASANFYQRIRSGEFGERRDEMERLMAFALKHGLGAPPAPPPPEPEGAMA